MPQAAAGVQLIPAAVCGLRTAPVYGSLRPPVPALTRIGSYHTAGRLAAKRRPMLPAQPRAAAIRRFRRLKHKLRCGKYAAILPARPGKKLHKRGGRLRRTSGKQRDTSCARRRFHSRFLSGQRAFHKLCQTF